MDRSKAWQENKDGRGSVCVVIVEGISFLKCKLQFYTEISFEQTINFEEECVFL